MYIVIIRNDQCHDMLSLWFFFPQIVVLAMKWGLKKFQIFNDIGPLGLSLVNLKILISSHVFTISDSEDCCSTHLIDGDGTFNTSGLEAFMKSVKLSECGLSYAVVSIMGPQSSGMLAFLCKCIVCNFYV